MLDTVSKALFHGLARSASLGNLAARYGMARPDSFAYRFIAGETIEQGIGAAHAVEARGMTTTLDYLGERVTTLADAAAATREYVSTARQMADGGVSRNLSVKPTQLGLDVDLATCIDNLRRILESTRDLDFFVRIDMENSPYTDATLDIFETLWEQGYRNVGVVLQSCLRRSEDDLRRVSRLGARVRLVKGAYKEPKRIAYQKKGEVDAAFTRMMRTLLAKGHYPALATHDPAIIDATTAFAAERGIGADRFEFQMLYGIRRDLQASLVAKGFRMRVYIPFGRQWFPYFMRRLGERPANLGFVVRNLFLER